MDKRILIATPVNQDENIFKEYLFSLNNLYIPKGYKADVFFILHNCDELKKYINENQYTIINNNINLEKSNNNDRKNWKEENYYLLAEMRTSLLKKAREEKYDYLFMVDSDVLLHPKLLSLLINDNKDIVSSLSWTKPTINSKLEAPCAQYEGWETFQNTEILKTPGLYRVGWTGRCTLISSRVFNNSNISYYQLSGVDNTGSEDYAFCLRCYCNIPDIEIYIETRLPSRHLYSEKDYLRWMKEKSLYFKEENNL